MKKVLIVCLVVSCLFSCSQDGDSASSGNVDGKGGSLAVFLLKGNYLYTVDYNNLNVFNIQEEQNPIKINTVNVGFDIETLFSFDDYLFIGSRTGMYIYDVSKPELPKILSASRHFRACDPVVANGDYAYVTLHTNMVCGGSLNELQTYDIRDVENPILLNTRGLSSPKGLGMYVNYLIVCDDDVKIFDVSDATDSKYIASIPVTRSKDVIIRDNQLFIISEIGVYQYLLNESNIGSFSKLGELVF